MGVVGLRDVFVVAPAASFHHQAHQESLYPSQDHPIIPLLTAAPCLVDEPHDSRGKSSGIHLWQQHQQQNHHQHHHHHHHHHQNQNPNPNTNPYLKKPVPMLETAGMLTTTSSGGGATCQDCGNQAKKDCSHRRCRTCCKSRGFDCSTHVKSTWVPVARRRERQFSAGGAPASSASTSAPKKPRLLSSQTTTTSHTSTSNTTRSFDTSSSHQDASFREGLPGQVKAPAVFKCVRVSSVEGEREDEYAYQATVNIGGHVFKGILYDHGTDSVTGGDSNSNTNAIPNISELHLGGGASGSGGGGGGGGGGRNGPPSTSAMVPADMSGLLGGTNYGNPIN